MEIMSLAEVEDELKEVLEALVSMVTLSYLISVIFVEVKRALVTMITLVTFYSPAKRYVCQGGEGLGQA